MGWGMVRVSWDEERERERERTLFGLGRGNLHGHPSTLEVSEIGSSFFSNILDNIGLLSGPCTSGPLIRPI